MGCTHSKKKKAVSQRSTLTPAAPTPMPTSKEVLLTTPKVPTSEPKTLPPPSRSAENLVSAPPAPEPHFEETGKEAAAVEEEKVWCQQALDEWRKKDDSRESSSFRWPSAHELRPPPPPAAALSEEEDDKVTAERMAELANRNKMAFLEEREREKRRRKATSILYDDDDTLFEQPTRMPNMDFLLAEKHSG